jgi:hypothetical protein
VPVKITRTLFPPPQADEIPTRAGNREFLKRRRCGIQVAQIAQPKARVALQLLYRRMKARLVQSGSELLRTKIPLNLK